MNLKANCTKSWKASLLRAGVLLAIGAPHSTTPLLAKSANELLLSNGLQSIDVAPSPQDRAKFPGSHIRNQQEAQNRALIVGFISRFFNQHDISYARQVIRPDYIQHNPSIATGLPPFIAFFQTLFQQSPQFHSELVHLATEGDYVWVHSHQTNTPSALGLDIIDAYRIQDGKIAEHWDGVQPVSATSANSNTQFLTPSEVETDAQTENLLLEPRLTASSDTLEAQNRALVLNFYYHFFNNHEIAFGTQAVREDLIQHNSQIATGRQAFLDLFQFLFGQFPESHSYIVHMAVEGDLVWVHSRQVNSPLDPGVDSMDLFRIRNGQIAEFWDSDEPVTTSAANTNTQF